jgi:peptide/nickel transport system ATP-binding protein/oligopeptide transport system ATP-binding protein
MVLEGEMPSPIDPPSGCRFHTRCPFVIERCRIEAPQLLPSAPKHLTACHRVDELPAPDTIIPSDDAFSPQLERLVAAFGPRDGSEPGFRS